MPAHRPTQPVAVSNVYVASLPPTYTDALLLELMSPYGQIISARVMCDPRSRQCKGYGFVLFANEHEALEAINGLAGHMIDGHRIQVRFAHLAASPQMQKSDGSMDMIPSAPTGPVQQPFQVSLQALPPGWQALHALPSTPMFAAHPQPSPVPSQLSQGPSPHQPLMIIPQQLSSCCTPGSNIIFTQPLHATQPALQPQPLQPQPLPQHMSQQGGLLYNGALHMLVQPQPQPQHHAMIDMTSGAALFGPSHVPSGAMQTMFSAAPIFH